MKKIIRYYAEVNDRFEVVDLNKEFHEFIGKEKPFNIGDFMPEQDFVTFKNIISSIEISGNAPVFFRLRNKDNELCWTAANAHRSKHDSSIIKLDIRDIFSLDMIKGDGYYDEMTGVLSKSAITDYAQKLMEQTPKKQFYFFLMDVDNFKSINDTYGHMKGDEVIVEVARIAREHVGNKGLVGRIGGDEFMLVLENINEEAALRDVLREIRYNVREKYAEEGDNFTITTSLGGALFPDYASNYDDMFKLADKMLYIAKAKGRDRYIIYTPSVHGDVKDDKEVNTLSQRVMQNRVKTTLIMELMTCFLKYNDILLDDALKKVLTTYNLDEIYLIDKKTGKSKLGLGSDGDAPEIDLSIMSKEDYEPLFETYPIKVINMYDLQKGNYFKLSEFMVKNNYRIVVVYYMRNIPDGGFMMYISKENSNCRFAETDFADLTYFSRMLELSGLLG